MIDIATRDVDRLNHRLFDLLRDWLPGRRWFPAKGADARIDLVGAAELPAVGDRVRVLLCRVRTGSTHSLLQVPLVLTGGPTADHPVVGRLDGLAVLDGAGHPAFVGAWLAAADGPAGADLVRRTLEPATARVLTGEQSNTSVVLSAGHAPAGILKVLRSPAAGDNPDVDVPRRLVEVGWDAVPAPLGWLEASWSDTSGAPARGHLGVLSAFIPGAADGFELACSYARRSAGFEALAGELGAVVASMHGALARAYGTRPGVVDDAGLPDAGGRPTSGVASVARTIEERFTWARAALPSLTAYDDGVRRVVAQVVALPTAPARQRVHGDLHLGQVLRSGGRWFVTDFEGEPLAPLSERIRPDLAVRDLAGVLRSFDYAAAVGGLDDEAARPWIRGCRAAFLDGYLARACAAGSAGVLMRALELDKALYEAVYESRNRPSWLHIPLAGLDRLLAD